MRNETKSASIFKGRWLNFSNAQLWSKLPIYYRVYSYPTISIKRLKSSSKKYNSRIRICEGPFHVEILQGGRWGFIILDIFTFLFCPQLLRLGHNSHSPNGFFDGTRIFVQVGFLKEKSFRFLDCPFYLHLIGIGLTLSLSKHFQFSSIFHHFKFTKFIITKSFGDIAFEFDSSGWSCFFVM